MTQLRVILLCLPVLMTGCLGGRSAPDATSVLDAAPLTLPPSFELRPPRTDDAGQILEAAAKTDEIAAEAAAVILGTEQDSTPKQDSSPASQATAEPAPQVDSWLVKKAGGDLRDTSIRELMALEQFRAKQAAAQEKQKGWFEKRFGRAEEPEQPVDDNVVPARRF